jgi:hypothetical protein
MCVTLSQFLLFLALPGGACQISLRFYFEVVICIYRNLFRISSGRLFLAKPLFQRRIKWMGRKNVKV